MCISSCRFLGVPDPRFMLPVSKPQYAPDRDFATVHTSLNFSIDFENKSVSGMASHRIRLFRSCEKIQFDAVEMKISSVKDDSGKEMKYSYDGKKIFIPTPKSKTGQEMKISIEYKIIKPSVGIYFIGPDKNYPKKPVQVWTHSETSDARYWFPCHDEPHEKPTMEMFITVPQDFVAVSNGRLAETTAKEKMKTYHWVMDYPIPSYLAMFAAGRFSEIKEKWKGVDVVYYCEKGREDDAKRAFGKTPKMLDFFSNVIGVKYPFEKYAQIAVSDFIFGGMEHTTATTQTDNVLHDERAARECWNDNLVAHELAHQWFGDMLTCRDWSHAWLNESFATYFDALFQEYDKGKDEFAYEIYSNARTYFTEDAERYRRPIATNIFFLPEDLFDRHLYEKGSVVLHMIRNMLGDETWWKCIKHYVEKNRNNTVITEDFMNSVEEVSGRSMKKFFDQWIYRPGHPEMKATFYWDKKTKESVIRIAQTQKTDDAPYSIPVIIDIITKDGTQRFEELLEEKQKQFKYKTAEPVDVRIDPDNVLLKKMEFLKPREMWFYQLEKDPNSTGRINAAWEISKSITKESIKALEKRFMNEKFWGVQAEIATALGTMKLDDALEALIRMVDVDNPKTRRTVAAAIGEFRDDKCMEPLRKMLADKKSYYVPGEAAKGIGKLNKPASIQILKQAMNMTSWNDVIKSGALAGLAHLQSEESIDLLKKNAEYGNGSFSSRITAIRSLGYIGKGRQDIMELLMKIAEEDFSLVQIACSIALGDIGDERAVPVLEKLVKGHRDGRVKRLAHESIRKIYPWLETDIESFRLSEKAKLTK